MKDNWLIRVITTFSLVIAPLFIIIKAPMLLGYSHDPNIDTVYLLDPITIQYNFEQYYNWGFLKTIWIHNGIDQRFINQFFLNEIWVFLFLIVTSYGIFLSINKKTISPYLLPLVSILTIFLPQLMLLDKIFNRYTINFHVFVYLLTISLFINLSIKSVINIISFIPRIKPIVHRALIVEIFSYFVSILLVLSLFLPVMNVYYPLLHEESTNFEKPGFREGVDYILENYSIDDTILGMDDGWRADWYFFEYNRFNVVYEDGWSQYLIEINKTTDKTNFILFMDYNGYFNNFSSYNISMTLILQYKEMIILQIDNYK